jgi:hypothetical protein
VKYKTEKKKKERVDYLTGRKTKGYLQVKERERESVSAERKVLHKHNTKREKERGIQKDELEYWKDICIKKECEEHRVV